MVDCNGKRVAGVVFALTATAGLCLLFSVPGVLGKACPADYYPSKSPISGSGNTINSIQNGEKEKDKNKLGIFGVMTSTTTAEPSTTKKPVEVTVFTENNFMGRYKTLTFEGTESACQNLPKTMWNRIQSVNTHGNCVKLCDNLGCQGRCMIFKPGSPHHNRLRKHRFHNQIESAQPCQPDPPTPLPPTTST